MNIPIQESVLLIESWFKSRCDDLWEHHNGITIETTDNPGWLVKVSLCIDSKEEDLSDCLKKRFRAEFIQRETHLDIYAPSFSEVICAASYILERSVLGQK